MYCSLPDEVATHEVLDTLVAMGKTVLLPVVTGETTMQLCIYRDSTDLETGAYNILEPTGEPFDSLREIDVAVVPAWLSMPIATAWGAAKAITTVFCRFFRKPIR